MEVAPLARCQRHPDTAAGWACLHCEARLCADCAATRSGGGGVEFTVCCLCRGAAQPLRIPRTEIPYRNELRRAWRYPLSSSGLLTMVGAGLLLFILGKLDWLSVSLPGVPLRFPLGSGIIWGYVFSLIRQVGNGSLELDPPDFSDMFDLLGPAFRGLFATTLLWVPALVLALCLVPSPPPPVAEVSAAPPAVGAAPADEGAEPTFAERARGNEDVEKILKSFQEKAGAPAQEAAGPPSAGLTEGLRRAHPGRIWLMMVLAAVAALAGVALLPMSLLMAATGSPWYQLVNPLFLLGYIRRIPRDYALATGAVWGAYLAQFLLGRLGATLEHLPIPLLPGLFTAMLRLYPELVIASVLGSLLYLRGTVLGAFGPEDAFVLAQTGDSPRGLLPEQSPGAYTEEAPPEPPVHSAFSGTPSPAKRTLDLQDLSAEEDFKREGNFFAVNEPLGARIAKAIADNHRALALNLYRTSRAQLSELTALDHFNVGRLAAGEADYPLAVRALEQAAKNREDPLAPRALVVLARLLGERMKDVAGAERLYREVLESYPGTEGARFAQRQLKSPAG